MRPSPKGIGAYLTLGVVQGLAAWSAYAVLEFVASSVVFRFGRPYARFTAWHWQLTGQLLLAFLAAGAILGALAGLAVFTVRNLPRFAGRPAALLVEHAAGLTLALAMTFQLITQPAAPQMWWRLLVLPLVLVDVLLLTFLYARWSMRFGLLTNAWVMAGLFLSGGQLFALQFMGVARQLGVWIQPWYYILSAVEVAGALGAVWLGRRWRRDPYRIFAGNWAAIGVAGALLAASFVLGMARPATVHAAIAGTSAHPNVILIVMDTVRADHLSIYGYPRDTTPNLRRLAADSAVYAQAVSAADVTLTSHASIFSGLYASWHGAYCQGDELYGRPLAQVPTMAEVLASNGYHTFGVAANLFLRSHFGLQRGFQEFRIPRPVAILPAESWYMLRYAMRRVVGRFTDTTQFDRLYSRADAVNQEFFSMLDRPQLAQAPFFAFFNYMDAHFPYIPPSPYDRLFPGKDPGLTQAELAVIQDRVGNGNEPLPPVYTRHSLSQYDGGIAYLDSQIGQLVDWLKREQLYDNALIVVTADHGEAFGERRLFQHGNSVYANLLHVPLLVKYPQSAYTGMVEAPVSLVDILPTVLNRAGVPRPGGLQGMDLLDPAAVSTQRNLFSESFPCPVAHGPECPHGCLMRTVISWPNKYIFSSNGKSEVYELSRDPDERHNLFGAFSPASNVLASELNAWINTMPARRPRLPRGPAAGTAFRDPDLPPEGAPSSHQTETVAEGSQH